MPSREAIGAVSTAAECRAALDADAADVAAVIVAAWRASYAGLMPAHFLQALDVVRFAARWRRPPSDPRAFRQVLLVAGVIIGAASGGPADAAARGELYSINVHPEHWGRGAGRRLLRAAEARLRENGFAQALLWVAAGNVRARRFYESAGWRRSGHERTTSELT